MPVQRHQNGRATGHAGDPNMATTSDDYDLDHYVVL